MLEFWDCLRQTKNEIPPTPEQIASVKRFLDPDLHFFSPYNDNWQHYANDRETGMYQPQYRDKLQKGLTAKEWLEMNRVNAKFRKNMAV